MATETLARQLHDRLTRGLPLSAAEQQSLNDWYARQDQAESELLCQPVTSSLSTLRREVDESTGKLRTVAERIQTLTAENEALRRKIDDLQAQVTSQSSATRA